MFRIRTLVGNAFVAARRLCLIKRRVGLLHEGRKFQIFAGDGGKAQDSKLKDSQIEYESKEEVNK